MGSDEEQDVEEEEMEPVPCRTILATILKWERNLIFDLMSLKSCSACSPIDNWGSGLSHLS